MYSQIPTQLKLELDEAPKRPGVYIFRDEIQEVLYVGKAVNLFNRSRSYFANYRRLDPRLQDMVRKARNVEYVEVENEVEALLLETNLIKKYDPPYNILMTDDKSYIWVKIESDMDFPRVRVVRTKLEDGADYFGPFPAVAPIRRMLKNIRKIFPYRSCARIIEEVSIEKLQKLEPKLTGAEAQDLLVRYQAQANEGNYIYSSDRRPCLYYHLGLCTAPCTSEQSKVEYREYVNGLKRFFRSEHAELKKQLAKDMQLFSKRQEFEKAAEIRNRLRDLEYLTQYTRIDETVDEFALAQKKAADANQGLQDLLVKLNLPGLELTPEFKIECYDISNIQGTNATSAMVVSVAGRLRKDLYRKFKIKTKTSPDDFAMLQETMQRRLKYLLPENKVELANKKVDPSFMQPPNLMVIDGGKGQLSAVLEIMQEYEAKLGYKIPTIGLAKKYEEVFIPEYDERGKIQFKLVRLSHRSAALRILQAVRDEAHRFGLGYHRLLRSKGMVYSDLDLVPGVGEVTKKRLILAFGSVDGIKKASIADIEAVVKNKSTAMKIKKLLL